MRSSTPAKPASLLWVLFVGGIAAATPLALSLMAEMWDQAPLRHGRDAITAGIGLSAVMLVPASVFGPAVGAMFPDYDRATPVAVIDDDAFGWLLGFVTIGLFFGGSVLAFDLAATPLLVAAFGLVVGGALVLSAWLVQHSLSILDPDRLRDYDEITGHLGPGSVCSGGDR